MAIKFYDVLSNGIQHVEVPFNYTRGSAAPIDNSTHWSALSAAEEYAKGNLAGYGVPYVGQIITVEENSSVVTYVIENEAGHLKKVGDTESLNPTVDTLSDAISANASDISALSGIVEELPKSLSVTVEKQEIAEEGFLNTYVIKQGGNQVGTKINIPKDFLVKSAKLSTDENGKFIDFVVNSISGDANESHIRLDVNDLVDVYTAVDSETIDLTITDKNEVSAFVKDGSLTWSKMSSDVTDWKSVVEGNIEKLDKDLSELSGKVEGLSGEVSAISGDLDTAIKAEVTARENAITALTQTVSSVSTDLNGAITAEVTAREGAINDLSVELKGDIATAKEAAILSAKTYTDEQIATLDFTNTLSSLSDEILVSADAASKAYTDTEVKALSDSISGTVDTRVSEIRTEVSNVSSDLVGQIATAKSEAIASAETYTDEQIAALSIADIYATKSELNEASATTLTNAKAYTDEVSAGLSVDSKIATTLANAKAYTNEVSSTLNSSINAVNEKVETVSSDLDVAEGIISTINDALGKTGISALSSNEGDSGTVASKKDVSDAVASIGKVLHFKGVISTAGKTFEEAIAEKYGEETPAEGDIVLDSVSGTEYVYTLEYKGTQNVWVEIGDEQNHATKSELSAEKQAREAADNYLSGAIDNKVFIDGTAVTSLSVENISQDDYHSLVSNGNVDPNTVYIVSSDTYNMYDQKIVNLADGTEEKDAVNFGQISALSGTIMAEVEANKLSSITLGDTVFTPENNNFTLSISSICGGGAKDFD